MFTNLIELIKSMPDEKTCREYVANQRWADGKPVCPYCQHNKCYVIEGGKRYKCGSRFCYKKFSVITGTVMEASNIPVSKWLTAFYLVTAHKKGISSYQLAKDIGIAQRHSWFMIHRIREAMRIKTDEKLNNTVEIDEVYIGGKVSKMNKSKRKKLREEGNIYNTKTMVFGMIERGGNLKLLPMANTIQNIQKAISTNVDLNANIITDANPAYTEMGKSYNSHEVVNHSAQEYVRNKVIHTNSIEGAFSMLKRSILGIYHQVTPKHLSRYCDETAFRYNLRKMTDADRFNLGMGNIEGRLKYKELISAPVPEKPQDRQQNIVLGVQGQKRPVYQLFDGEIIGKFNSLTEAQEMTGIRKQAISKVLRGELATTKGYQWIYA